MTISLSLLEPKSAVRIYSLYSKIQSLHLVCWFSFNDIYITAIFFVNKCLGVDVGFHHKQWFIVAVACTTGKGSWGGSFSLAGIAWFLKKKKTTHCVSFSAFFFLPPLSHHSHWSTNFLQNKGFLDTFVVENEVISREGT